MDSNANINNIKKEIYPLYAEMLSELRHILEKINTRVFCFQRGKDYPCNKDDGILFVGKATNGWTSNSINVDELFDINNEKNNFYYK
ncbi:hypothetical protein CBLAS_1390 [Campylobacter blaseri]|uniref:Uncharacterized protein n=1 Tax=Campylobacter blaseri TaxID=2042961 RepID=A0A2P8QYW1_9BACT|nr:hypothetical protein [Campylobacter blaseri]PSM51440.1 hypothetical protein CQ405_07665 [Campylobacter blaseri]PSM52889.1 hypothetical protein CRN67_07670 [Campylobacter blaseri]QKF86556.1 hypothetical protein CBLAS_1390 [Campylobacter blaseri]